MGGSATSYVQGDTGFKLWPLQGKWSFKLCTTPNQDLYTYSTWLRQQKVITSQGKGSRRSWRTSKSNFKSQANRPWPIILIQLLEFMSQLSSAEAGNPVQREKCLKIEFA